MKSRLVASAVISAALIFSGAGCTLLATGGTTVEYEPADGVAGSVGDIEIRNAIALSENGNDVSLVLFVVNTSKKDIELQVHYFDANGDQVDESVTVPKESSLTIGSGDSEIVLRDAGVVVGGSVDVFFEYAGTPGVQLHIPVLAGSTPEYSDLLPGPAPVVTQTATPEPTETAAP